MDNRLLLIAGVIIVALVGSNMSMLQDSVTMDVEPGDTIEIPLKYEYDNGFFFGSPNDVRILVDADQDDFPQGPEDVVLATKSMTSDEVWDTTFTYTVPDVDSGQYELDVYPECSSSNGWTGENGYTLTLNVESTTSEDSGPDEPEIEEPVTKPVAEKFNIDIQPDGSTVYINGEEVGTTPLNIDREVAEDESDVSIKIEHDGYNTETTTVNMENGDTYELSGNLQQESDNPISIGDGNFIEGFVTWLLDILGLDVNTGA